ISSVDSGNLIAHMLTLRQGLLALVDSPLLHARAFAGLADTLGVLADVIGDAPLESVAGFQHELEATRREPPATISAAERRLARLEECARQIELALPAEPVEAREWAQALLRQCRCARDDLLVFAPAVATVRATQGAIARISTLREIAEAPLPADVDAQRHAQERIGELERLAQLAGEFALIDYDFLYDRSRHLLSIGYNLEEQRLDTGFYDLLASEARLCS